MQNSKTNDVLVVKWDKSSINDYLKNKGEKEYTWIVLYDELLQARCTYKYAWNLILLLQLKLSVHAHKSRFWSMGYNYGGNEILAKNQG